MRKKLIGTLMLLLAASALMAQGGQEKAAPQTKKSAEVTFPLSSPESFEIVVKKGQNDMGDDFNAKPCCIEMERETNVHINWVPYSGKTYDEKVVMLIASNDLPDAFSGGQVNIQNNYDSFIDFTDYLEDYMPTWNAYLNANPVMKDALTMSDGGIYCLPIADSDYGTYFADGMLYINDKFLNECLGGKVPTTLDEMYEAMKIAKTTDFNGNGLGDEEPLVVCNDYKGGLNSMFSYFGMEFDKSYVMYTDNTCRKVEFVANTPAYKDALETFAKWYKEGLINSDLFSMQQNDYLSRYRSADNVAFCITHTPDFNFDDGLTNWTLITNLKNKDYTNIFLAEGSFGTKEGFAITKKCQNPEVLCAWFDAIHKDFKTLALWNYGEEGKIWKYADDGKHYMSYLMGEAAASKMSYGKWRQTYSAHNYGPKYGGMYQDLMTYSPEELTKGGSRNYYVAQMKEQIKEENTRFSPDRLGYWDADKSEELDELTLAIQQYCASFKANAIVNGFTDADWNNYCNELEKKLNVSRYVSLYNEYLSRNN